MDGYGDVSCHDPRGGRRKSLSCHFWPPIQPRCHFLIRRGGLAGSPVFLQPIATKRHTDSHLGCLNYPGTTQTTNSAYWLSQAQKPSNYNGALTLSMASEIFFLTPVAGTQSPAYTANPQEFILIGSTPEPASYAMFGIGVILLSLGTFHRSRKRE